MWNQQQNYHGQVPPQQSSQHWPDQRFEDADEEDDSHDEAAAAAEHLPDPPQQQSSSSFPPRPHPNDSDDDDAVVEAIPVVASSAAAPRGKPEAMAAALAAAHIHQVRDELQDDDDDDDDDAMVVAEPILEATPVKDEHVAAVVVSAKPPPKKKAKKSTPARKSPKGKASATSSSKKSSPAKLPAAAALPFSPTIDDPADPITPAEQENLKQLMEQFCKVPLLAEFSRPVTLLHPELSAAYSKIVPHPIDLGMVCRKLGRKEYRSTMEFQLDMWRIFSNCVRYHSHPSNKEAVPSFVSIALHLRDFFNALWQEYLMPSDPPALAFTPRKGTMAFYKREMFALREEDRKKRLIVSGLTCLSVNCLRKTAGAIDELIKSRGLMDNLDKEPLFGDDNYHEEEDQRDLAQVALNLKWLRDRLFTETEQATPEYTVDQFFTDFKAAYTVDVFENNAALRIRVGNRLQRFLGKILVPVHEANCRGVTQSSIWGCMAAAIWARESSKKPFWPALVLGILAPDDQKEDWHWALTERNENRLPEKLRSQLTAGKRKAEQALKRQSQGQAEPQSFFLVEFLGTHEFIWVRETDIVETFEPDDDPNVNALKHKKNRYARNSNAQVVQQKNYQAAVEEAKWALEEFEMQLQDACGDFGDEDDNEAEDSNYSYGVLCLSDDEADEVIQGKEKPLSMDDIEEANELIASRGLLDFSVNGRKNAKKRAQALKKQRTEAEKKLKTDKAKKVKAEQSKKKKVSVSKVKEKERENKKEEKDLEKRRKKRAREREKALKQQMLSNKKNKRRRTGLSDEEIKAEKGKLGVNKKARATAIVNAYLTRMASSEDYSSLGLGGVLNIPAANVDSSGLLGMALAFRSAAGELSMPDESGDHEKKPWDAIDVDSPATPEERIKNLEKQAELLQNEIKRCKSSKAHREELAEEADRLCKAQEEQTLNNEMKARESFFQKKKKKSVSTSVSKKTPDISPDKSEQGAPLATKDEAHDDVVVDVAVADKPHDHDDGDDVHAAVAHKSHDQDDDNDIHMDDVDKSRKSNDNGNMDSANKSHDVDDDDGYMVVADKSHGIDDEDDSHEGDVEKPELPNSPQIAWDRKSAASESAVASDVDPSDGPDKVEE